MALSKEENELLTHVGPGTPMGNLLRRYWTPACLSVELPEPETSARVRLLGEDLVAFRTTDGVVGLIEEHCPHRGASLYYGRNEENGLRCVYHGWKFDTSGQCIDMPSERRSFADQIQATAYPTHESGGIVWTYMGPQETITPFRDFGWESLPTEEVRASKVCTEANWVQVLDGNYDTAHVSYLHKFNAYEDTPYDETDRPGYPSNITSLKILNEGATPGLELVEDWYGFRYTGIRTTPNGHTHVRINTYVIPYTTQVAAVPFSTGQIWVVPIDDTHSWRYNSAPQSKRFENPGEVSDGRHGSAAKYPYRPLPPTGIQPRRYTRANDYGIDRSVQADPGADGTFTGIPELVSQDFMVTETMGPIYDRTRENLGTTDLAVIRLHSLLLDAATDVAEGKAPPAVGAEHDYRSVRAAEKILEAGEDWRRLGTNDDPIVQQSLLERQQVDQSAER